MYSMILNHRAFSLRHHPLRRCGYPAPLCFCLVIRPSSLRSFRQEQRTSQVKLAYSVTAI